MPATEPLVVPAIPELGTPSRWLPGSAVGSVLETRDANGAVTGFYVLLPNGVQKITSFVADLLRTATAQASATPTLVSPDKLIHIPAVDVLNVGYYPSGKLNFVDTAANPVTCVGWQKQSHRPAGHDQRHQRPGSAGADRHGSATGPAGPRRPRPGVRRGRPGTGVAGRGELRRDDERRRQRRTAGRACIGCRRKVFGTACSGTSKTLEPLGLDPAQRGAGAVADRPHLCGRPGDQP